jgi:hypothetical protein
MQNKGPDVSRRRRKPNGQFDNEFATLDKGELPSLEETHLVRDYRGYYALVPNHYPCGLAEIAWDDGDSRIPVTAFFHYDGTVMIPSDCQAPIDSYVEDNQCIGLWVELMSGRECVLMDGVPFLPPW